MTREKLREIYETEVKIYQTAIEFDNNYIAMSNKNIARLRKEDKEMVEFVWGKGVLTELDMRIWGKPEKYAGVETKKEISRRNKAYRWRKKDTAYLEQYKRKLETLGA